MSTANQQTVTKIPLTDKSLEVVTKPEVGLVRNIHVEVDQDFHRKLKMMCVVQGITMKDYALKALQVRLETDEKALASKK